MFWDAFFKLVRISIVNSNVDFPTLSSEQWKELYTISFRQAVVGVLFNSINKLPNEKRPPRELVLRWMVTTERIRLINHHVNNTALKVESLFRANGFQSCILKGQGIAQLYPDPELRTAGDIDIWVEGNRNKIISFVGEHSQTSHAVYHHIDGLNVEGVEVETHFTPSYMSNPFANRRLQKWIRNEATKQFEHRVILEGNGSIFSPTIAFNRVFILHHIYRHFFYEGIGLRQMMDFYYVLKQGFSEEERAETLSIYKKLNLTKFAGAVIFVLHEIFGLEEKFHITAPNEKYGKVLLEEILSGGNFGQANKTDLRSETKLQRGVRIIKRNLNFIWYEPAEVLWMPYFKVMNNLCYVRYYKS